MSIELIPHIKAGLNYEVVSPRLSDGAFRKVDGLVGVQLPKWSSMTKFNQKYSMPCVELLA